MKTQGLSNTFGLCFGGFGGGGSLILGDFALPTSSDAAESEEVNMNSSNANLHSLIVTRRRAC